MLTITKRLDKRVHAYHPRDWSRPATDFWILAGDGDLVTASGATNLSGLDSFGWTTTSIVYTNSVTADLFSAADDTPPNFNANASGDVLRSPLLFGSYSHVLLANRLLGYTPTKLGLEFYGAFTTASAGEAATYMGFDNGSAMTCAVYSDGTNFQLSNDGGTTKDAGAAIDTSYHTWKIIIDSAATTEWFIDGTSQGTLANKTDVWPSGLACVASTTNRWAISWAHVWYE